MRKKGTRKFYATSTPKTYLKCNLYFFRVVKEGMNKYEGSEGCLREPLKVLPRARNKPLAELAPPGMALSCVLSGAAPETALQSHFLVEFGGNIGMSVS